MLRWLAVLRLCAAVVVTGVLVGVVPAIATAVTLPDGRGYELVSPPDKNGGDVIAEMSRTRAAVNGDAVGFISLAGFADIRGTGIAAEYVSRRTEAPGTSGWATHATLPTVDPLSVNGAVNALDTFYGWEFSDDLSKAILRSYANFSGDPNIDNVAKLYLREDLLTPGPGTYTVLNPCPVCATPLDLDQAPQVADATPDFGHVIFEMRNNLTADASGFGPKLYEWDHGTLRLAGILPADEGGGPADRSVAGQGAGLYALRTISDDGSRIFFNDRSTGRLYVRVDHATTDRVNASERTDCAGDPTCGGDSIPDPAPDPNGELEAAFETASADGTKVFFTTAEQLTDDDANAAVDLYLYDGTLPASDPHNLTRISVDDEPADGTDFGVTGVMGASADGSYVYFSELGQIVLGGPPTSGYGIYVWHAGSVRYVGTFDRIGDVDIDRLSTDYGTGQLGSRLAPDGRRFAFISHSGAGLTGYDHNTTGCGDIGNDSCLEVYLYDYAADQLRCVSCNPSGAPATADASFNLGAGRGAARVASHLSRALSDDGRYVFFTSGERLVAADQNGKKRDVYEYDATTGTLHLLTSGRSADDAYFMDATPNGHDVFFTTRDRLIGWDVDGGVDLYDARIGGGFPEPAAITPECAGDACRGPLGAPPAAAQPSSAAFFHGDDNVKHAKKHKAKRCKKGKVRKRVHGKVRCVKHKHKSKRAARRNR